MSRVLITGGAGFIGSQLGYYLYNKGNEIILLDDLSFGYKDNMIVNGKSFGTFIYDDIRNEKIINYMKNIDIIFHFAGIAPLPVNQINPQLSYSVNVAGWGNILESARREKIPKIIFASTSAIYENNTIFPVSENNFISPYLTYSLSKKHAEELAHSYMKLYNMDITILRFFNVYGPHHDFRRKTPPVIAYIIKCLMLGEIPILHSNGNQERDYIYIDDICAACEMIMIDPRSKNEIFNLSTNSVISMIDIYKKISLLMNSNIKPIFRDPSLLWDKYIELNNGYPLDTTIVSKETNKYCKGSYDKAKTMLGWEPITSFDDGIKRTVEYAIKTGFTDDDHK